VILTDGNAVPAGTRLSLSREGAWGTQEAQILQLFLRGYPPLLKMPEVAMVIGFTTQSVTD